MRDGESTPDPVNIAEDVSDDEGNAGDWDDLSGAESASESEREDPVPPPPTDPGSGLMLGRLITEATSIDQDMTHLPNNKYCRACLRAFWWVASARYTSGRSREEGSGRYLSLAVGLTRSRSYSCRSNY